MIKESKREISCRIFVHIFVHPNKFIANNNLTNNCWTKSAAAAPKNKSVNSHSKFNEIRIEWNVERMNKKKKQPIVYPFQIHLKTELSHLQAILSFSMYHDSADTLWVRLCMPHMSFWIYWIFSISCTECFVFNRFLFFFLLFLSQWFGSHGRFGLHLQSI